MSKIFINLLFLEGGTNLIFLTGSKALALSEGGCLPKLAIFNSYSRAATSFLASISAAKWPFLVLLLNLIHAIHELPLTQPVLNLELFELPLPLFELLHVVQQVVHPVMLSQNNSQVPFAEKDTKCIS